MTKYVDIVLSDIVKCFARHENESLLYANHGRNYVVH